eukprot:TRINITY_DN2212_c2_g2_i4.p1 TRINITY_DN2212_c2_g2~~TRINITY_DN2212_c2_g2_i4.p1  ORF type:complete len:274 (+),score=100.89 TRINITY_DN2212_c2_g2_i4:674-1495(+)
MDPYSRRQVYNLLQEIKKRKTIVMSTHYMEEADLLADRIMIMSHGQLRAMGTPLDLKKAFNVGYRLSLSKKIESSSSSSSTSQANKNKGLTSARFTHQDDHSASHEDVHLALAQPQSRNMNTNSSSTGSSVCSITSFANQVNPEQIGMDDPIVVAIRQFIESHLGAVSITNITSRDVTFSISAEQITNFGVFFEDLDNNLENLHVTTYGLTMAGLNEVFLQIVAEDEAAKAAMEAQQQQMQQQPQQQFQHQTSQPLMVQPVQVVQPVQNIQHQ